MAKLSFIEGIGTSYTGKLNDVGIRSTEKFLEVCGTKKGREDVAEKTGISSKLIMEWANRADLSRVKGVGNEYADLLEAVGVDTVPELGNRNPVNLYQKMVEINEDMKLVRKLPSVKQVTGWVEQAKDLPRALHY